MSKNDSVENNGDQFSSVDIMSASHMRNDSSFSMDSFILGDNSSESLNKEDSKKSQKFEPLEMPGGVAITVSDALLTDKTPPGTPHSRRDSGLSADSGIPPTSPVVDFFKTYAVNGNTDEVPSDGSCVTQTTPPTPDKKIQRIDRVRFPSFDSVGSSGSVVKKAPTSRANIPKSASSQSLGKPISKILPYNERRKIMKQRQAQEQQKSRLPSPRPPIVPSMHQNSLLISSNSDLSLPSHNPHIYPPIQGIGLPLTPHISPYPPPGMSPYVLHHPIATHDPSTQQQFMIPPYRDSLRGDTIPSAPRLSTPTGLHARPPMQPIPPFSRSHSNGVTKTPEPGDLSLWNTSSSCDSSDGGAPARDSRMVEPPPPPPILPPPPATHIRQDSSGSVSSLGSFDRGTGRESEQIHAPSAQAGILPPSSAQQAKTTVSEHKRGFFGRLSPWKKASTQPKDINDFHRRNQAFLSKIEHQKSGNLKNQSPVSLRKGSPSMSNRRTPHTSMDKPPASFGSHRRLNSIENDDWGESYEEADPLLPHEIEDRNRSLKMNDKIWRQNIYGATQHASLNISSSDESDESNEYNEKEAMLKLEKSKKCDNKEDEMRNRPLPPSGISTNMYLYDSHYQDNLRYSPYDSASGSSSYFAQTPSGSQSSLHDFDNSHEYFESSPDQAETVRVDNTTYGARYSSEQGYIDSVRKQKSKKRGKSKRRPQTKRCMEEETDTSSFSSTSISSREKWLLQNEKILESKKSQIIEQWKQEVRDEAERNRWDRRFQRYVKFYAKKLDAELFTLFAWLESFFGNLPLTIGAVALASANLGVVWFKFAEENLSSCEPVHFHSAQCSFPEFPGCFYCDKSNNTYKIAVNFHFACSCFAGLLALSVFIKFILARRVVFDALCSPTTASPAGLLCMTLNIVFAGRGALGMMVVTMASFIHLCLAVWFMYIALAYHIMPEPSWFPNTTGIGISAVKCWLYHPMAGHFLMAISLIVNFFVFPVSLIRVFFNRKISAPVGWMQMSAPNVSLYALTIMAQPSFLEETPDVNSVQKLHRKIFLPCMHFLFSLCILGMIASVTSLIVRWDEFRKQPFSPAHSAFLCPTLSHANAIQAYRGSLIAFSSLHRRSFPLVILYTYWIAVLVGGTITYLYIATRFLICLPEWTHFDLEGDIEPPEPYETAMSLSNAVQSGDTLVQSFISPVILQANETGQLVLTRDAQGKQKFVRTRKVTALGFEPIMDVIRMEEEREILLDWVARHQPRRRNRTLSVPGIDFNYGTIGPGTGVYGMEEPPDVFTTRSAYQGIGSNRRQRSSTLSPATSRKDPYSNL